MKKERNDYLIIFGWGILLCYLTHVYVMRELTEGLGDYGGHAYTLLSAFNRQTWLEGWMSVPYCMWHLLTLFFHNILLIPVEYSASYSACVFTLFTFLVFYWMFRKVTAYAGSADSPVRSAAAAFGMCLAQPFYFEWLDLGKRYLGTFSPNPIYSPTYVCARGFGLLCLCLVCDIWGIQKDGNYRGIFFPVEKGVRRYYIWLAVMLFLSVMAKPTFAEMFVPAAALIMLWELVLRLLRKDGSAAPYFRYCLTTFFCALPALLCILLQFAVYSLLGGNYGGESSFLLTGWLEVWRMFTQNVGLSAAMGLVFPLFVILINPGYFIKNDMGRLALAGYGVGFLEAALLGESEGRMGHANFMWPMMSGMLLLFTVAMLRLLVLERTQAGTKGRRGLLAAAWFLFCIHVLYGVLFILGL